MKLKELSKLPKITAPKSFVEKAGKRYSPYDKKYGSTEYRYETREYAKCRMYGDIIKGCFVLHKRTCGSDNNTGIRDIH